MATADNQPITFSIPGVSGALVPATRDGVAASTPAVLPGLVKVSVRVGLQRDGGALVRATAVPGEDIVAVHIQNGPVLYLHPATARDLMRGASSSATAQRSAAAGDEVPVSLQLQWPGAAPAPAERGLADVGHVVVSGFQVLTGFFKDKAAGLAASLVVAQVDGQVDAGVYSLQPDRLDPLKGSGHKLLSVPAASDPMLVLLHGTFVETVSTFAALWKGHASGVAALFANYGHRVYALDHPTLGASPIANARTLVDALPVGARLHLVTHSRGGLVAEVLALLAGNQGLLTAADRAFFSDPAYASQLQDLVDLAALVAAKDVQVLRVVRVACPARGTLLASGRLDAYLSVLKWTLDLAQVPLLPGFVDFIAEVARRRADPSGIPGLAAMIPGTPLVNWLNAAPQTIPGDLRVVAGDLQHGDTLGSWLKALLSDAYYRTDNDIVVQTSSMYGGAPRSGGATYLLDQGPGVTHFAYFENDTTANAVVKALTEALPPAGFQAIGPMSWAGQDASGQRGLFSEAEASPADASKPAVFVLPGILGSNLKQGAGDSATRIWLSPRLIGGFSRLAYQPGGADQVSSDGPVGSVYGDLTRYLAGTHEVIPFGYDWRRPLEEEAARLAGEIKIALDARTASDQPVRILAHSLGGLLARTVQLVDPVTWDRLMAHAEARLLMLGTPNGGSWAPMQVLSGDDTFGNALAALGSPLANQQARGMMAAMPGFVQLQAGLLDEQQGLASAATWQKLADADLQSEQDKNWWHRYAGEQMTCTYAWGLPTPEVLRQAQALRTRLDAQVGTALKACADKVLLVIGHATATPVGFEVGDQGFVYLESSTGDGRVPLESALLPGVRTWTLECEHGSLPSARQAFDAFADLLTLGSTSRLPAFVSPSAAAGATRGGVAAASGLRRSRPSRRPAAAQTAVDVRAVFALAPTVADTTSAGAAPAALDITVLNGNLTFVQQPLMIGHYRALDLTGTEAVVDRHLGGAMRQALAVGLYPDAPDTQRIFVNTQANADNPWQLPRPQAAIVVGMGEEGVLRPTELESTVCQGVKAWAQREHETAHGAALAGIELAATLLGSGGLGVTPGASARAIASGVWQANQRLQACGWPLVTRLVLVEWYLDRAAEAWRGLRLLADANPKSYALAPQIASGVGPLRRQLESGYRGANYDLISIATADDATLAYALDTRRARSEVRAQHTQSTLVRKLVERAATARSCDPGLGHTLFQLLVPGELKPFLSGTDRAVLKLDAGTAPIPWELLDTETVAENALDQPPPRPWAIRTQLLRTLSTKTFRNDPRDAGADDAVLVIGAPKTDPDSGYPPLEGARREAQAVALLLGGTGGVAPERLKALVDDNQFDEVIGQLMARPYRIVHIAGHGAPEQIDPKTRKCTSRGGVVLSQGVFMGPDEIEKLETVPELVFVNCCHLGGHAAAETLALDQPVAFAAGVADALIQIGVKCVVAAGWAVDDDAAEIFALSFYGALLAGQPFIDAVSQAREACWRGGRPGSKTWAAYQCYGDPNWTFRERTADAQSASMLRSTGVADGIASAPGLALALEDLAIRTRYAVGDVASQLQQARAQLRELQDRHGPLWGSMGAVAEAFGLGWEVAGDIDAAIGWYEHALQANDGSASVKAHEKLGNLRVRRAWKRAQAAATDAAARAQARAEINAALQELQTLAGLHPTVERLSLCGSAWKRLAQLHMLDAPDGQSRASLAAALAFYARAEALAEQTGSGPLFYPGLNRMAIELVLQAGAAGAAGLDEAASAGVRRSLLGQHRSSPDFWTNADLITLDLYDALAAGALAQRQPELSAGFAALHSRVSSGTYWGSVTDQLAFVLTGLPDAPRKDAALQAAIDQLLAQLRRYTEA